MAQLIKAGPFVGRGEERVAALLEAGLPDTWTVVCNKELVDPGGSAREVDFIIVGKHAIFAAQEKSWRGPIHGNTNGWVLQSGESHSSPLNKAGHIARRLAGLLRDTVLSLKGKVGNEHFVFPRVVLSADDVKVFVQDLRVRNKVVKLTEAVEHLRLADEHQAKIASIESFRKEIIQRLTGLPNRPAIPRSVGDYDVQELIETHGLVRKVRACHADGTERILKLLRRPDTAVEVTADEIENAILREYNALKSLSGTNVAPAVDPFFSWEEGTYWVIPIHPIQGDSLRAHRTAGAPNRDELVPVIRGAFRSLEQIHQAGIVHRGLSPDRIFVSDAGAECQITFCDFSIARIEDRRTVATTADQIKLDPEMQYRAPECKLSLELAEQTSDIYSLAASLFYWVTGYEPNPESEVPDFPKLSTLRSEMDMKDASFLELLFADCLQQDDQRRPSAKEVTRRIADELERRRSEHLTQAQQAIAYEPGEIIEDQYEVIRTLGQGGTADTYLVRDLAAQDFRVLKRIRNLELYAKLSRTEFATLDKLYHPNLPRVYDVRLADAPFHLKLEYIPGSPLQVIQDTLLGQPATCLRIARGVLSALAHLAGKGLTEVDGHVEHEDEAGWRVRRSEHSFAVLYDASESHQGTSADELFHRLLAPLGGRQEPSRDYTACVAVNDGRLRDFFERNGAMRYRWLWDRLRPQIDNRVTEREGALLVDMKQRCLVSHDPQAESLFKGILDHFTNAARWQPCQDCVARQECPIWWNVQSFQNDVLTQPLRDRFHRMLLAVHLRREHRPTIRDLRSALAFLLTHDLGCRDIHRERAEGQSPLSDPSRLYFNAAFDGSGCPDLLLDEFCQLDPALVASPRLDRFIHFHRTKELATLVERLFRASPGRQVIAFSNLEDMQRVQAIKRRFAFEARRPDENSSLRLPSPDQLIPYRHLERFLSVLRGAANFDQVRDELLAGISHADGVPETPQRRGLGLRLTEASSEQLVVIKRYPAEQFRLTLPPGESETVEGIADHLVLQHVSGTPQLLIGLDLFEFILRAVDGCVAGAEEQQALVEELAIFKNQLLTHPTQDVLIIESRHRYHRAVIHDGKIVREETSV